jgi:hypothetical protein
VAQHPPGQPSCPNCGARATARADACARCGFRLIEDASRTARPPLRAVVAAAAVAAVAAALLLLDISGGGGPGADARGAGGRVGPEVLASHPLSTRAAERRLEERYTSLRDDDSAAARCSALQPRPAHAIRRCRILYPHGGVRTVIVLTNPEGRELIVKR